MAKKLVLLTYTPRELDEAAYARFIREVDYPAFRQNPHIIDYSCWRTVESLQGQESFTHFDLMSVDDLGSWHHRRRSGRPRKRRALDEGVVAPRARPPGSVPESQDLVLRALLGLVLPPTRLFNEPKSLCITVSVIEPLAARSSYPRTRATAKTTKASGSKIRSADSTAGPGPRRRPSAA